MIIQNFHVGDFDPLPYSQVIGEKVSLHWIKLQFSVIFFKTIKDFQIPKHGSFKYLHKEAVYQY